MIVFFAEWLPTHHRILREDMNICAVSALDINQNCTNAYAIKTLFDLFPSFRPSLSHSIIKKPVSTEMEKSLIVCVIGQDYGPRCLHGVYFLTPCLAVSMFRCVYECFGPGLWSIFPFYQWKIPGFIPCSTTDDKSIALNLCANILITTDAGFADTNGCIVLVFRVENKKQCTFSSHFYYRTYLHAHLMTFSY